MRILWFTWKDRQHPLSGGAEVVNEELGKRLAAEGHEVLYIVAGYEGLQSEETRDGFKIIRVGGRWTVYWHAYRYYKKHLQGWADVAIDEVNTIPFFAKFFVKEKNIIFIHQLCRQIWFYQMFFPLSVIGYIIEPIYLWLLRDRTVVTVSQSTKNELLSLGFKEKNVHIISVGIEIEPLSDLSAVQKFEVPTILSLGALRPMKRTLETIKAFELFAKTHTDARLIIAGDTEGSYGKKVLAYISKSPQKNQIQVEGRVSKERKIELMQRSHVISVTSVKEGWGLIVTEANSQGTPAVVYDVDGLRDSVKTGETGMVTNENTQKSLASSYAAILDNSEKYEIVRSSAWLWSKGITFNVSNEQFKRILQSK